MSAQSNTLVRLGGYWIEHPLLARDMQPITIGERHRELIGSGDETSFLSHRRKTGWPHQPTRFAFQKR